MSFVLLVLIFGCGGKKEVYKTGGTAPKWVDKGSGAFDTEKGKVIYGVGVISKDPNPQLERKAASNRALAEIATTLNTHVASLMKDFMESHRDYTNPAESGSVEFVSNISKTVTDAQLVGAQVVDFWRADNGDLFALASLSYDSVLQSLKDKVKEAQEKQAVFLKAKADEAVAELNKELDQKKLPSL
jgi:hypothetical protein